MRQTNKMQSTTNCLLITPDVEIREPGEGVESYAHMNTITYTYIYIYIYIYELLIALCAPIRPLNVPVQYCGAVGVCPAHNRGPMWRRQAHILR